MANRPASIRRTEKAAGEPSDGSTAALWPRKPPSTPQSSSPKTPFISIRAIPLPAARPPCSHRSCPGLRHRPEDRLRSHHFCIAALCRSRSGRICRNGLSAAGVQQSISGRPARRLGTALYRNQEYCIRVRSRACAHRPQTAHPKSRLDLVDSTA